MRFLSRFR